MSIFEFLIFLIIFTIIDMVIIRFEIEFNIDLFYALHKKYIDKKLRSDKK